MSRGRRTARLALAVLLLLPWSAAARADSRCHVAAPALGADVGRACATVLSAVPGWDGRARVRLTPGDPSVAAETTGNAVAVHAAAWQGLSAAGRQEVLTHELVHVATDGITTARTPAWLVEGLAEAVALRHGGLADRQVAAELVARLRDGDLPHALPTAHDLEGEPAVAYQESWLAVDLLLRRYGDAAVLRAYRAAGTGDVASALAPLGMSTGQLTAAWRAEMVLRLS